MMTGEPEFEAPEVFDVFISYASADREVVDFLVHRLKLDGFRVWLDVEQIARGPSTLGQLADGIARSSHVLVCLSDTYIEREFTLFELQASQSLDPSNKWNRVIPVKVRPLQRPIPIQIKALNFGDITNLSEFDTEYQRITRLIHRDRFRPAPTEFDRETLQRKCEAAFKSLGEPNFALFQMRISTEAICKFIYKQEVGDPPASSSLDSLVGKLLTNKPLAKRFPDLVRISLSTVQAYGNFVVKDQMEDNIITQVSVQPGLAALKVLSDWTFTTYFGQPEKKDLWDSIWTQLPQRGDENEREIPGSKYILWGPRLRLNSLGALYAGRNTLWRQSVTINLVSLPERYDELFFEEVSRLIRLDDASIVRPLDANKIVVNGKRLCLYVVLEHVEGASAQDLAERFGPLPPLAACELCWGAAISLEGFHTAVPPIIHGDVKPGNILVDRYGRIKVHCIGRGTAITAEEASVGAAQGKIDSFLFASPEQMSGTRNRTPRTDLHALRATLFYLLTGEYEVRIRGSELPIALPGPAVEALDKLASCASAREAREALDFACQQLAGGIRLRMVIDCYREGRAIDEVLAPPPVREPVRDFSLLTEIPVEARRAWPLSDEQSLVWEAGGDTLALFTGSELSWRDTHPMRVRRIARGPQDQLAATSWDGQIRCFVGGRHSASATLPGAVGDVQFSGGRWVAGTWKHSLVYVTEEGEVVQLLEIDNGVSRIAVMDSLDRFAVADLAGGIAMYAGGKRVASIPPFGFISSMAFAGKRLMLSVGPSLVAVGLQGKVESSESRPGWGGARLLPSPFPGRCLLLSDSGSSWLIDESGTHLPYFSFPPRHVLISHCSVPKRFILASPGHGCTYWRDGGERKAWPDAVAAELSASGRLLAVTFPDRVELYEDPQ